MQFQERSSDHFLGLHNFTNYKARNKQVLHLWAQILVKHVKYDWKSEPTVKYGPMAEFYGSCAYIENTQWVMLILQMIFFS